MQAMQVDRMTDDTLAKFEWEEGRQGADQC